MLWIIITLALWVFFVELAVNLKLFLAIGIFLAALIFTIGGIAVIDTTESSVKKTLLGQKQVSEGIVSKWEQHATGFRSVITFPLEYETYYELKTSSGITVSIPSEKAEELMGLTKRIN